MQTDLNNLYYEAWKRLPERFRKDNNKDLYYVLYGGYDDVEKSFKDIKYSRNIDKAKGQVLDKLGENVGQFRQGEDDKLYRNLIKVRIIANMSIGDIPTINKVMSILLKEIYIGLEEIWNNADYSHEPAAMKLSLGAIGNNVPYEIIDKIKAAGVRVLIELELRKNNIYIGTSFLSADKTIIYPYTPKEIEMHTKINIKTGNGIGYEIVEIIPKGGKNGRIL